LACSTKAREVTMMRSSAAVYPAVRVQAEHQAQRRR
jgi:hypothetical protein